MLNCKFCTKVCKSPNSLRNHERMCKLNENRKLPNIDYSTRKTSNQYLKGTAKPLSVETLALIRKNKAIYWTAERRAAQSELKKKTMPLTVALHSDSYSSNNVCGRAKKSMYKDQLMHSSWELEVAMWFDDQNIKWSRTTPGFKYEWNNSIRTYFPDFYLPEYDVYVEVKGYETDRDCCKWKAVPGLVVLKIKEVKQIRNKTLSFGTIRGSGRRS